LTIAVICSIIKIYEYPPAEVDDREKKTQTTSPASQAFWQNSAEACVQQANFTRKEEARDKVARFGSLEKFA
jgi:hypothetical protein